MLLSIAKSKQPTMVFVIPLIMVLLWLKPFSVNSELLSSSGSLQMPLYHWLHDFLLAKPVLTHIITLSFIIIIGFMINRLNIKFIFIPERSYFSTLAYFLLTSAYVPAMQMNAVLPAAVLLLFALERILDGYKIEQLGYYLFDASLFIGIASFFYIQSVFLMAFVWAGLMIIRPFFWREWFFTIFGYLLPWLVALSIIYISGNEPKELIMVLNNIFIKQADVNFNLMHYVWMVATALILIVSSLYLINVFPSKKILARKSFNLLFLLFILIVAMYLFVPSVNAEIIFLLAIPLSLLFAHFFIMARYSRWVEICFWVFVLSVIFAQYYKSDTILNYKF